MKQLFYAIAVIVVLFFAIRLMSKVKDVPQEEESEHLENNDEIENLSPNPSPEERGELPLQGAGGDEQNIKI